MSYRTVICVRFALSVLLLLGGLGVAVLAHRKTERAEVHSVPQTVVSETVEAAVPKVRAWFSVATTLIWALFLFLVIYLAGMSWWFVCRVAYSDSDLLRLLDQVPPGDNALPRPDQLLREGD